MRDPSSTSRYVFWFLLAFSAAAVASISLQNLVWVAVALFLFLKFRDRQALEWPKGFFPAATLVFLATFFLAAFTGINPANSFQTVHKYLTFLLLFPLGAMAFSLEATRKLLLAFVAGASFCSFVGIGKRFYFHQDRIDSFSGDKMVFGGMLMVALLLFLFFLKDSPKSPWLWASFFLAGTALVFTQTRGAWVGFAAGLFLWTWHLGRKWFLAGLLALAAAFLLLPLPFQERIKSIADLQLSYDAGGQIQNSSQERVLIWIGGTRIVRDYPWGVGQGNLSEIYPKYKVSEATETTVPHLHNDFLQILAQNGWLGLGAYLLWIFSYYWTAWRRKPADTEGRNLNWAFLCVFSAVLVWGLTEYTFSHQFMNIQFFLLGLQTCLWKKNG
jgi:O-antigen ligase